MFAAALPAIIDQLADTSFRETFPKLLSMARSTCRRTASARVVAIAVAVEEKRNTNDPVNKMFRELLQRPEATRESVSVTLPNLYMYTVKLADKDKAIGNLSLLKVLFKVFK